MPPTPDPNLSERLTSPISPMPGGTPAPLPAGHPSQIGPYRILSHLGAGGFGDVYLAEQAAPVRRRVALKVIKAGRDSRAVVARLEAEREALILMDHPGVAKVFDAGVADGGRPFFAMEYVAGEPISKFADHERLALADRLRLMIRVCHAVQHAHMKGIIHRDLKPANILVELVDGLPSPKVIDFGVAKALRPLMDDTGAVTLAGQMIGTPEYMPPEQARGSAVDIDTRADVYALGAVLYELLTGTPPLESALLRRQGYAEMQRLIEQEVPEVPSRRLTRIAPPSTASSALRSHGRLPHELDWIAMRCLEKDRARRYDSAAALARDLERFLADEPVEAGPPSLTYRAGKFVLRHRALVAAASLSALVCLSALATTSWALRRAIADRAAAETHGREAEAARAEAEAVTSFLTRMLESADPSELGRNVLVTDILARAERDLAARARDPATDADFPEARLRQVIGSTYLALGDLDKADTHLIRAVEIRDRTLGADSIPASRARFQLAGLRFAQGRFDEAEGLYRACLQMGRAAGLAGDELVFGSLNNLAQIASRRGRLDESIALQRQALDGMRESLGPFHEHTLGATINLGARLHDAGRTEEGRAYLGDALAGWREHFGVEHPGTLLAMHNLALLCMDTGDLPRAEAYARQVLETRLRTLGERHPDTIGAMSNLGLILSRSGNPECSEHYRRAWELAQQTLGEDHDTTLTTALNLVSYYEAQDWPEHSLAHSERAAQTLRRLAARPDATPSNLNAAAWHLLTARPESAQDPQAALSAAIRATDLERRAGGSRLWEYLDTLALAYSRTGAAASAAQTQREAIAAVPDNPAAKQYLSEMQERLARYEAAITGPR